MIILAIKKIITETFFISFTVIGFLEAKFRSTFVMENQVERAVGFSSVCLQPDLQTKDFSSFPRNLG